MMNSDLHVHTSQRCLWLRPRVSLRSIASQTEEKAKAGPRLAHCPLLASPACRHCGWQGGGSERSVWWLSNWQETLLCSGLSDSLQRRWRELHQRRERPFHRHCVQFVLASWRLHSQQIQQDALGFPRIMKSCYFACKELIEDSWSG